MIKSSGQRLPLAAILAQIVAALLVDSASSEALCPSRTATMTGTVLSLART